MSGPYAYSPQLPRRSSFAARKALKPPDRPIAIRTEYTTNDKTLLVIRPRGDALSPVGYEIEDEHGIPHFTVSGRKFNDRACREFRDSSGLPLFELHRKISVSIRGFNAWVVTLPGFDVSNSSSSGSSGQSRRSSAIGPGIIATVAPRRGGSGNFKITFENVAAGARSKGDKDGKGNKLTLEVARHGNVLAAFDVIDGDRKVAEVRESIQRNERLALLPGSRSGYRPVLDAIVTPGVDLSLVSIVAVIASDWVFDSNYRQ
ncbi:hypothetical protein MPDQ_002156 [Monascus purpureus]|uniref:Tubby C-terminal domain-containing protein n=1 Tax=Monascus purpureus TaxID=5098 RepID=A0A507QKZ0_MONPU|nr:hypothetical protein MPDQ_002156 [Monascus purpureus]BDD62147.1 hypothetical protein MAP00_007133 [Monascus purpureus]